MARIQMHKSSGNVFLDMGIPRGETAKLQIRSRLIIALEKIIQKRGLTQRTAAKILGVTQPRVGDLVRGNIDVFSIDTLAEILDRSGVSVTLTAKQRRRSA